MQPVEINAGTWYLRSLRADDRITDVPALSLLGGVDSPADYVEAANSDWDAETRFVWAICIPHDRRVDRADRGDAGRLLGPVVGSARDGYDEALDAAIGPVSRFAEGALYLTVAEPFSRSIG